MILELGAKNFMSYEDMSVVMGNESIEIVGQNGSGKSAMLEILTYAQYGITRVPIQEVSRKEGDGSHEVYLVLGNVSVPGDKLKIVRGRKASGTGYATVEYNGELIADGPTEVSDVVQERLQMDSAMYLSSVFFGLSDEKKGDKLISVTPAARLENHQTFANIGMYRVWKKKVDDAIKPLVTQYDTLTGKIEAYESVLEGATVAKYNTDIDLKNLELDEIQKKIEDIHIVDLRSKLDRFKTIKDTITQLTVEIKNYNDLVTTAEENLEDDKEDLAATVEAIRAKTEDIAKGTKILAGFKDVDKYKLREVEIQREQGRINADIILRQTAVAIDDTDRDCPLCESKVSEDILNSWKNDIQDLQDKRDDLIKELKGVKKYLEDAKDIEVKLGVKEKAKSNLESKRCTLRSSIEKSALNIKHTKAKLTEAENKLKSQESKFNRDEYEVVYTEIKEAEKKIDEYTEQKTKISGELSVLGEKKAALETTKDKLKKSKAILKGVDTQIKLRKVISKAFSKQEIPMNILRDFNTELESRATDIYNHFRNGYITIEEVPGSLPGIVYYLVDTSGRRLIASLSKGEKMLVFVSLRVALTQLMSTLTGVRVDYLVLDEIAGNLDEINRTMLISLVNGVLRKFYTQIIMVSHVSVRDVFTRTISVVKGNDGISSAS